MNPGEITQFSYPKLPRFCIPAFPGGALRLAFFDFGCLRSAEQPPRNLAESMARVQ
jgi:hypothetical protein